MAFLHRTSIYYIHKGHGFSVLVLHTGPQFKHKSLNYLLHPNFALVSSFVCSLELLGLFELLPAVKNPSNILSLLRVNRDRVYNNWSRCSSIY